MIELNHVFKKYGSSEVLKDINLTLPDTGMVCILGKSGSGKTTLLNMIGLFDKPTSGKIVVDGKDISTLKGSSLNYYYFKYIGFVSQNFNLFNNLSVKDNILLINNKNIDSLLEELDIKHLKKKKVSTLSGGEKQRVAIARSIINSPKILLCDEPTGSLDSKNAILIMDLLKKLSKRMLVIVVSHNEELVNAYQDMIINIKDGEIDVNNAFSSCGYKYQDGKVKISLLKYIKIVLSNIHKKRRRNMLIILALFISFFTLGIVLGISDGFIKSIERENKDSMSKFPIYISKTSSDLTDDFNNLFIQNDKKDKVYAVSYNHINKIDDEYVENLKVINKNLKYKIYSYEADETVYIVDAFKNIYPNFKLLNGVISNNPGYVFLLLNDDYTVDANLLNSIGLFNKSYKYEELVGYKYFLNDKEYMISGVGIVKKDIENIFPSGFYYNIEFSDIPSLISLYPIDYSNKQEVIKYLKKNRDILFTDYADTITNLSKTLVKSIKIILLGFSFLSLFVSIIMIGILCYVSILERIRDIGILKSLGVSNKKVKFIFYLENILICLSASLISMFVLMIVKDTINKLLYNILSLSDIFTLSYINIISIIILSILVAIISSWIPIKSVKKYSIIDTINYD